MEKIQFDTGVEEFVVNGGAVLRFNPADPNLYARFLASEAKLQAVEAELTKQDGDMLQLFARADEKMKEIFSYIFGEANDFHKILAGVNLLAVADNGKRVVVNFMEALQPILLAGAERCASEKAKAAVAKAKHRRASQG